MKATYNPATPTKFNRNHRREKNGFHKEFSIITPHADCPGGPRAYAIATLRIYWPGTVCYACLWVHVPGTRHPFDTPQIQEGVHTSGSGSAGGYGYCKMSSAAGEAIANAGFTLSQSINGRGESAVCEAMHALAAELGHPDALLHIAHA
jgi:hypothetical protein